MMEPSEKIKPILIGSQEIPRALDIEKSVLGSMLVSHNALELGIELLSECCFYSVVHKNIFNCIRNLYFDDITPDILTVAEEVKKSITKDTIENEYYLSELVENTPTSPQIEPYCKILIEKAELRELIILSCETSNAAFSPDANSIDIISNIDRNLLEITENNKINRTHHLRNIIPGALDDIEQAYKSDYTGLVTGFEKLDKTIGCIQRKDYIVLAGRPSMGKTTLALNIAMNIEKLNDTPILIFSLEMSKEKLISNMLAAECLIDSLKIRTGNLTKNDFKDLARSSGDLANKNIYINDDSELNAYQMRTIINRHLRKYNIGLVIIDYLQLMTDTGRFKPEYKRQEIGERSRILKATAKKTGVPIILLSQLSREIEKRPKKFQRPFMSDLKESGNIEEDADIIMFVHRPYLYGDSMDPEETELIIGKSREGPIGTINLYFKIKHSLFKDV